MGLRRRSIGALVAAAVGLAVVGVATTWGPGGRIVRAQGASPAALAPVEPDGQSVRHFSADLTIRHRRVSVTGESVGASVPDLMMRVVRDLHAGRWRTTMVVDRQPEAVIAAPGGATRLPNPFSIARIEFGDDDETLKVVGHDGRPARLVTAEDLRLVGAAETVRFQQAPGRPAVSGAGGFFAEAARRHERREDLARRLGAPTGRVGGLDRYVQTDLQGRREVLVAPDTALPAEVTVWATGGARMRTAIVYQPHGTLGHVRRLMRSEHQFGDVRAGRAVTEVAVANVVIDTEVPR